MSEATAVASDAKGQLRRVMGFWDVLLFCIATVLGPRWIAAAARNGQSSISLWILAALLFFVPTAYIVVELSTRFPEEGGLYVWTKMAFGDFHGFVAGWTYWIYTVFYFPGLLLASAAIPACLRNSLRFIPSTPLTFAIENHEVTSNSGMSSSCRMKLRRNGSGAATNPAHGPK